MIDSTDTCPALECCPNNPYAYLTPPATPVSLSLNNSVTCSTCYNEAYENRITATGLGLQLTWTITDGELPPGLTFHGGYNELGYVIIDGTPTTAGHYEITVQAESPNGTIGTGTFSLNVVQITTTSLPDYVLGEQYYAQLEADGGSGNYGWGISSGELPDGLILDPISGVIYGAPTGLNNGDQPIQFQVFDITCEQFNPVFVPQARISATSSRTQIATVLGFDEFIASAPPKRYHTANWSGHAEHQLWVGGDSSPYTPPVPTQIGGARYDYSGYDHIDTHGTTDHVHVKDYSVQCNGDSGRIYSDILGNTLLAEYFPYNFKGYYGLAGGSAPNFLGHPTVLCSSSSIPYAAVGDVAVSGTFDSSDLWGSQLLQGSINLRQSHFGILDSITRQSVESGVNGMLVERYLPIIGQGGSVIFPPDYWIGGNIIYDNDYSCVLSDEYTDAEALSNAAVLFGTSRTAENLVRTVGFTSRFTTVNYDITCTNLVPGASYVLKTQILDLGNGTSTVLSETFVATTATKVVNHNIPNPNPGHSLTVANPTINFA